MNYADPSGMMGVGAVLGNVLGIITGLILMVPTGGASGVEVMLGVAEISAVTASAGMAASGNEEGAKVTGVVAGILGLTSVVAMGGASSRLRRRSRKKYRANDGSQRNNDENTGALRRHVPAPQKNEFYYRIPEQINVVERTESYSASKYGITNSTVLEVYRQDNRSFEEIIASGGFHPKVANERGIESHMLSSGNYNFVSTSSSRLNEGSFGRFEYKIRLNPGQAVNTNLTLSRRYGTTQEGRIVEFAVPDSIRPEQIIGWREFL
ncbi:hypothetical protein HJ158_24530 [Vibrio parahaemolyticus]|nr:hypothetical protein [Vibrio parahaemolyticus]